MRKHLIIIDDDPIFRLLTIKMISKLDLPDLKLHECENGQVGIRALEQLSEVNENVSVFLDINTPVLNGWEFLEKSKQNNYFNIKNLQVFIISSSTDDDDIDKANNHNIVKRFIHKPLKLSKLKSILVES